MPDTEKTNARNRAWYWKNIDRARKANKERSRKYYPTSGRDWKLRKLGWTLETFEIAKAKQEERCAICKQLPDHDGPIGNRTLCADHAHTNPPKPRALLCGDCNRALGLLMDNPELCEAAADYLRAWGE